MPIVAHLCKKHHILLPLYKLTSLLAVSQRRDNIFLVALQLVCTLYTIFSGGSRPSVEEGARLTRNVQFCEDNSGTSKKMRYFQKNKVGAQPPRAPPLDPPLISTLHFCVAN